MRASLAAVELRALLSDRVEHEGDTLEEGVSSVRAWLACPCAEHIAAARALLDRFETLYQEGGVRRLLEQNAWPARSTELLLEVVTASPNERTPPHAISAYVAKKAATPAARAVLDVAQSLRGRSTPLMIQKVIGAALIPWALGSQDVPASAETPTPATYLPACSLQDPRACELRARVRVGELEFARLELAAFLGDQAAILALGAAPPVPYDYRQRLRELTTYGPEATRRAATAIARRLLPVWRAARPSDEELPSLVSALRERCLNAGPPVHWENWRPSWTRVARLTGQGSLASEGIVHAAWVALNDAESSLESAAHCLRSILGKEALTEALSEEVLPWALGESDPLRQPTGS